jgi:PHD/YefM family antitoxin component YafN of YafNO toxin-antitoxin module
VELEDPPNDLRFRAVVIYEVRFSQWKQTLRHAYRWQVSQSVCPQKTKSVRALPLTISILYKIAFFLYSYFMNELSVTEAREQFPAIINQAKKRPVRITRHGIAVALVIDPSLYESLIEAQEELENIAAFDAAMLEKGPNIPWEQVQKDLKLI